MLYEVITIEAIKVWKEPIQFKGCFIGIFRFFPQDAIDGLCPFPVMDQQEVDS